MSCNRRASLHGVALWLQRNPAEGQVPARGAFIISSALIWVSLAAPAQVNQNRSVRSALHTDVSRGREASPAAVAMPSLQPEEIDTIDMYGNEVSAAVATYRLDATGAFYELHSPQTEVPRLAAPRS
jgi:hypothetical protein